MKRYNTEADPILLEPHFSQHMMAMTVEGLHLKSDIATELALRDKRIAELEAKLCEAEARATNLNNELKYRAIDE